VLHARRPENNAVQRTPLKGLPGEKFRLEVANKTCQCAM